MTAPGAPPPKWFLRWTNIQEPVGDEGRPWGDGSEIARRRGLGQNPWDTGCRVTPLIGGLDAMTRMAVELQDVIDKANKATPKFDAATRTWPNGHVYIADWRFNCLRDLSTKNTWKTDDWGAANTAAFDQTAIGLVRKLMQAGIQVRLLLWLPHWLGKKAAKLQAHLDDHRWAARLVQAENARLMTKFAATRQGDPQLGVVALDKRTADVLAPSHHQKLLVLRSPWANIAFAGGVDLAFTRRDDVDPAGANAPVLRGDWQSGTQIPRPSGWPREAAVDYYTVDFGNDPPSERQKSDLPVEVYGDRQSWHDQHLVLEGEVVATLEDHFRERWQLAGDCLLWATFKPRLSGQVILSTDAAFDRGLIEQLPPATRPVPITGPATHSVQMWRTIPLSGKRTTGSFRRGEFTVMAGLANACQKATQLIWIFDQFFWSIPLARLLQQQVFMNPSLHVVIVLPPHADTQPEDAHQARHDALAKLTADDSQRIAIYAMWNPASNTGVYVHAKVQMFDDELLVCGSANLNRRSFLCDTEMAFAVADKTVLDAHQQALWKHLFPGTTVVPPAKSGANWGKAMFDAIAEASGVTKSAKASPASKLMLDPWEQEIVELPNHSERRRSVLQTGWLYDHILDATSVDPAVEHGRPTLAKVVERLETRYRTKSDGSLRFPYRKPA
jgi:phosphatidylserine/phosphatidylglycerophosphate/cardiolipin synthase-like enzyme